MQFSKWKIGAVALVCMLLPGSVHAQIVKNDRLLSESMSGHFFLPLEIVHAISKVM